ncbi:MAG: hypothetical protein AAF298_24475 [Cyanobacteria bacterium P01_A01_bin.40]
MSNKKSPEEIQGILSRIPADSETILVGGQAINLWATAYLEQIPELQNFLPFSSEDLDFIGGKVEAVEFQERLGGDLHFPPSFSPSPSIAILTTKIDQDQLRVDFLSNAFGLDTEQIANSAIIFKSFKLPDVEIKVLNPILCVAGKLKSYTGLPQYGRQDKKHLQIAILIAQEYIKQICLANKPRSGLKLVERMGKIAKSEAGLKVWHQDKIDILHSIPIATLHSLPEEQWQKFCEIRLPQLLTEIEVKRLKYQQIVENRLARKQKINQKNDQLQP